MLLYIVRHGETEWNNAGLLQGVSDVPLNENGRSLARITGCFSQMRYILKGRQMGKA